MDLLAEEIEHAEFMADLYRLSAQLFGAFMVADQPQIEAGLLDHQWYGDEPVFSSIIFDRMVAEHESGARERPAEDADQPEHGLR